MCDHPNREAAMVKVAENVWCDPCLSPLVRALNDGGLATVGSCCGHGRRPGSVLLADGREVLLFDSWDQARALDGLWPGINGEAE